MNLKAAIDDMAASIRGLDWKPKVIYEDTETGSPNLVTIVPNGVSEEFRFGSVKRTYTLTVRAHFKGKDTDPFTVQQRCKEINAALTIDRRRGGNALTTIVAPWEDETNEGRQGVIMASEPQIQLIESC